ncbi:glycine-rich protein [Abeliophyllum distichum]|uniref:Glycine-rich protein n=1 Tax=Abeliophyllum distichum TaxID=126358 RepID=A0ABD1UJL5_9LAMI
MEGGRDPFFGFGNPFGNPFGGFGGQRSLMSSFFGGNDPFDDPFFSRPFGNMFESSLFGSTGSPFMDSRAPGFLEHQPPQPNRSRGPIIEELNSDDENDGKESGKDIKDNPRKHGRSSMEPFVEDPDDEASEKKSKQMAPRNDFYQMQNVRPWPQTSSFSFQSSAVTYGGANGAYYSSSRTRRTGSDGLTVEERKEADSSIGQASHMLSRGIHEKGHSVTRKLNSDGRVDTMQTLHNLNEDELVGFEDAWKGKARQHPGWSEGFNMQGVMGSGSSGQHGPNRGGWALPSTQNSNNTGSTNPNVGHGVGSSRSQQSGRMKADIGSSRGRSRAPGTSNVDQAMRR